MKRLSTLLIVTLALVLLPVAGEAAQGLPRFFVGVSHD